MVQRYVQRPDLRDWFLIMVGIFSMVMGYAYMTTHLPADTRHTSLHHYLIHMPLEVAGIAWFGAGLFCMFAGIAAKHVGGFTVGIIMPFLWGLTYLVCFLMGDPGRGWILTGAFWAIAGAVYCVGGLVDPGPMIRRKEDHE